MLAAVSSTTRMRPWLGANSSTCMARHRLLEQRARLVKRKGLDALIELGERLAREPRTDQLTIGLKMVYRRRVRVDQVLTQLVDRLLDGPGIVGRGHLGRREGGV